MFLWSQSPDPGDAIMSHAEILMHELISVLKDLVAAKPNDHTELDRRYAIMITDLEKLIAYFGTYIVQVDDRRSDGL